MNKLSILQISNIFLLSNLAIFNFFLLLWKNVLYVYFYEKSKIPYPGKKNRA